MGIVFLKRQMIDQNGRKATLPDLLMVFNWSFLLEI